MVKESQIDVEPAHLKLINKILKRHITYKTVWAYGSRVNWTANQYSDLDLVVFDANTVKLGELKDDFTECDLPFSVDIVLWEKIPENFKNKILEQYVVLQEKPKLDKWNETNLGEICSDISYGYTASAKQEAIGPKFLRITDIVPDRINWQAVPFCEADTPTIEKYKLKNGDIVIARTGATTGYNKIIKNISHNTVYASYLIRYQIDKTKAYPYYIGHILQSSNWYDYIDAIAGGSAQPGANAKELASFDILLPPLLEQKAIASVLSSLDDKIDLLHRQNKTLEAMAETLFRQWFVEEAKEDWDEKVITEFFEIRDGTHDSPKQTPIGKPLLTSKHICTNRLDIENAYLISEEDFANVNKRSKVDTNDILFSMIGTIGLTYLEQSETIDYAIKNIGLFKTSQNPEWRYYTYLWLSSSLGKEFVHEHRSGSTQEYISLGSLRSIVFDTPPTEKLDDFNSNIQPYFEKIRTNLDQIRTLEKLRDTLLPRLMSGEVRVEYEN